MRVGAVAVVVALLGAAAPAAAAPSQVLYVGDSLGVGTTPGLARELASSARVRGDSRIGRPSGEGLRLLERMLSPADDIVVFDLGTNDDPAQPGVLARDLAAARTTTGDRCLIVATLNRPPLNGVSVDRLNQAVRSFASGAHDVQLVDWNALATQEPSLLAADRVHATPAGYAVRSQLFAEAVGACADQAPESGARPAPAPRRPKKRRPRKPAREVEVPGIESSGISFTEPVAFESRGATLTGKLLLPDGKPPYPAVVMLPGSGRQEAEGLASDGIAALTYDRGGGDRRYEALAADARAAVASLARRRDIGRIAVWGGGEGGFVAPMAAAGNARVAAVLVVSPSALAPAAQKDWAVRRALGGGAAPIGTYYQLAGRRRNTDLGFDPARWWAMVDQPVLAIWGTRDTLVPIRASAQALRDALDAGGNRDRTFRWVSGGDHWLAVGVGRGGPVFAPGFLQQSVRWLRSRLTTPDATPRDDAQLPPANGSQDVMSVSTGAGLATPWVQIVWLLAPSLLIAAALARLPARGTTAIAAACALAALAAVAAGVAVAVSAGGVGVTHVAGVPALFALAFVLAACGAVATAALLRRRAWLAAAGPALWLALVLFWLL